jgi:hypothetical protein
MCLLFVKGVVSKESAPFLCAGSANLRIGSSLGCWKVPDGSLAIPGLFLNFTIDRLRCSAYSFYL